ncbi:FG-GAP-like repeat-containing protein [Rosistilla oblonga]|uniref:FG-GAP-like repeat-containing protein n=1 Tax=Rosistilla oblonga TaxID=2527990 RepID=UPI003A974645
MAVNNKGRLFGNGSDRKSNREAGPRRKLNQLRRLVAESLEPRQLLAADLAPTSMVSNHNYLVAEDVNADFRITPSDALIVLNQLARGGEGESDPSDSAAHRFTDVNADGRLTPLDALIVINRLTLGEAEPDPLLDIELDVTQDGTSLLADGSRNFEVNVGDKFDLEVRYTDQRSIFENRFGAFSLYVDILATGIDSFRPVLSETQIIELSENLVDAGGSLTLAFDNQPDRIAEVLVSSTDPNVPTLTNDPERAIEFAIEEGLGLGADTVSVSQAARSSRDIDGGGVPIVGTGDPFRYIIRFTGENAEFVNIPNLLVNTNTLTGATVTQNVTEVPVYTSPDNTQINPNSLLYNIDFRSSSMNDRVVYGDVRSGVYNPGNLETFDEIGGVGPAQTNGLYDPNNPTLLDRFEAFSIEMQAVRAQDNVRFTLDLPDNPIGSEISLYGSSANSDIALTPDMISIGLVDDPTTPQDERTGLAIGRFVIPTQLSLTAVTDNVSIDEDATATRIDVLANDLPSPDVLNLLSVGPASHGTASIVQGEVFYQPAANYFGSDTFTYEISNGTQFATGTVVVDVRSINDPPTAERITVTVPRGETIAIPYTSFLLPQPANEARGISITEVSATLGQAVDSTGGNLVYRAPDTAATSDQIAVTFSDGIDTGNTVIDVVIINAGRPVAEPDTLMVNEDTATTFSVAAALLDNDTITTGTKRLVSIDTAGTQGTVALQANGTFIYTPPENQFGTAADSFRYTMTDGSNPSEQAIVTIDILSINDEPVAGDRSATINTTTTSSIVIDLSSVISPGLGEAGVPGETVQISQVSDGSRGATVSVAAGAMGVNYTPVAGITGTETFTYTVADQFGLEAVGTVTVTITNTGGGGTGGTASISGVKFHDLNDNGARDAGEPTLPDWTIYLDLNNNGSLDTGEPTTLTDAQGAYLFEDLLAGDYSVRELAQTGWRQSYPRMINSDSISIDTGDYAGFTTVADIDADGDLDVIVANEYSNSKLRESNIALLTNNGNGNFAQSTLALPRDARPHAVVADRDFTGDGIVDLVVASAGIPGGAAGANGLQMFVGTGEGFNPSWQFIPAGDGPSDLAARDFDGDGNVDLVVTNHRSDNLSILMGLGGGSFTSPIPLAAGDEPVSLSLGELASGAGDILAVANYRSGSVSIYTGSGGAFALRNSITGLTNPTDVRLVDIDGDGNDDLVVADSGTDTVRSYRGNGSGGFTALETKAVNTGEVGDLRERPEAIDVTDFNRDGAPDLLIANRVGGESLWLNDGDGTFTHSSQQLGQTIPNFNPMLAKSIAVANLDGDDQLDYVVAFAAGGVNIHTTTVSDDPGFYLLTLDDGDAAVDNDFGNFQYAVSPTATVSMSVSQTAITENANSNTSVVTVRLSEVLETGVTVTLGLAGAATRNADYTISTTQLTIPAGSLTATATIASLNDEIDEGDGELIALTIDDVVGATENGQQQATITIIDDDDEQVPTLQISSTPASVIEGDAATVTATLSRATDQDVIVSLGYDSGTATRGEDFNGAAVLTIPAGQTTASLTLLTVADGIDEPDEAIIVDVLGTSGASELGLQSTTINLVDVDATPPVVQLSASATSMPENGGSVTFTATLDSASANDVIVELAFSGTATRDADYITPTQIVIPAGNLTGSATATSIDDLLDDNAETVNVEIFSASGATAAAQTPLSVTIVDDDAPTVSLVAQFAEIIEDGGYSRLTAVLSSALQTETVVELSFSGSAIPGQHFTMQSQRIVIPADATSASILIQAINNQEIENADRVIQIEAVGANASTTITIRNEDGVSYPLRAAGTPSAIAPAEASQAELSGLYAASLDVWQQAGLSASGLDRLRSLSIEVADLEGDVLGRALNDRIAIDSDAAGFGWFVDATPLDDEEFEPGSQSDVSGAIDLLSVILHEQAHALGLDHGDSPLMSETLEAGTRRTPSTDDVDKALQELF